MASKVSAPLVGGGAGGLLGGVDAEQGADGGEHLARLDRLDEVAVGAGLQTLGAVAAVDVDGGDVQDGSGGGGRLGLEAAADLEAGQVGQADVEDDEVGLGGGQLAAPRPRWPASSTSKPSLRKIQLSRRRLASSSSTNRMMAF